MKKTFQQNLTLYEICDEAICRDRPRDRPRKFLGILYKRSSEVKFCKCKSALDCCHFRKPTWVSGQRLSPNFPTLCIPMCSSVCWTNTSGSDVRRKTWSSPRLSAFAVSRWCKVTGKFSPQQLWAQVATRVGILGSPWDQNFGNQFLLKDSCQIKPKFQKIGGKCQALETEVMWVRKVRGALWMGRGRVNDHMLKTHL